jgi:hypothetical protein
MFSHAICVNLFNLCAEIVDKYTREQEHKATMKLFPAEYLSVISLVHLSTCLLVH